jgi:hypothetical protein
MYYYYYWNDLERAPIPHPEHRWTSQVREFRRSLKALPKVKVLRPPALAYTNIRKDNLREYGNSICRFQSSLVRVRSMSGDAANSKCFGEWVLWEKWESPMCAKSRPCWNLAKRHLGASGAGVHRRSRRFDPLMTNHLPAFVVSLLIPRIFHPAPPIFSPSSVLSLFLY